MLLNIYHSPDPTSTAKAFLDYDPTAAAAAADFFSSGGVSQEAVASHSGGDALRTPRYSAAAGALLLADGRTEEAGTRVTAAMEALEVPGGQPAGYYQ